MRYAMRTVVHMVTASVVKRAALIKRLVVSASDSVLDEKLGHCNNSQGVIPYFEAPPCLYQNIRGSQSHSKDISQVVHQLQ